MAKSPTTNVYVYTLQPDYNASGTGGVFSAYYGPPDYSAVSPGVTAVYNGRQAGPIYAGVNIDPTYGNYEDQGLFAFKPGNVPIATFATQTLTYDFVNQYGTLPVWVYIELNKGGTGDIMYQYVPPTNPTPGSWYTVNAAAGSWLAWTYPSSGITIGSPMSLADIAAANPGKTVDRVYLTEGMGDSYHTDSTATGVMANGTVAWVDTVTIGTMTYNFKIAPKGFTDPNPTKGNDKGHKLTAP